MTYVLAGSVMEFLEFMETQGDVDESLYKYVDGIDVINEIDGPFIPKRVGTWHANKMVYRFEAKDMEYNC